MNVLPDVFILLTATIDPGNTPFVARQDPRVRENDYLWALKGWLSLKERQRLIFCENSGASLKQVEQCVNAWNVQKHQVTLIATDLNSESALRGKGFGEMEILSEVLTRHSLIGDNDLVIKVTGRHRSRNKDKFLRLLLTRSPSVDLSCNLSKNLTVGDSRMFVIKKSCAVRHLLPRQNLVDDRKGIFFEHVLAQAVHSTLLDGGTWSPLVCDPSLYGYSGTSGAKFGVNIIGRLTRSLKQILIQKCYQ
ncbi:MAG: hypothetical protein JO091_04540 [Acidobacteriaceae bacterium]|nr:hypothetical protein [Acidobacteriaceae bacterium]